MEVLTVVGSASRKDRFSVPGAWEATLARLETGGVPQVGSPAFPVWLSAWPRWLPGLWSVALAVLLLGPGLGPGYVLTYDMVWVPDLAVRTDTLGLGTALPRAVPSDAVVAVLDEILPGAVLQKVVLLGALVGAGVGAARLAPPASTAGRLAAVSVYLWNPFVVERLLIGHWPVILGYAVLPWVITGARRVRETGRLPAYLLLLLPLGSLSSGAGLVTAAVLLAFSLTRRRRTNGLVVVTAAAANAPWLVAGLLHAGSAESAAVGARVFALHGVGELPAPLAAAGLGGIWNAEVVLPTRQGPWGVLALLVLVLLAAAGVRSLVGSVPRRDVAALAGCWVVGWGVATATWAQPAAMGWLVSTVPGAGVLRDGARLLAMCAPLLTVLVAHGVARTVGMVRVQPSRASLAVAVVLAPVAVMPDAAFGASGRLAAVDYPEAYADVRAEVAGWRDGGGVGDALVLPFTSYRAPEWNGGRKVLDPVARFVTVPTVTSDELVVSGVVVPGEDPRARTVQSVLEVGDQRERERALAALGLGVVVEEQGTADGARFAVTPLDEGRERPVPTGWWVAMLAAWTAFVGLVAGAGARIAWAAGRWATRR
jgi:hypothetical protein